METSRCKKVKSKKLKVKRSFASTFIFLCIFASLRLTTFAQTEQKVSSTITNVTVFINQAQITRTAKVSLDAGVTNLVFDQVSPLINLNSIQIRVGGNITLLSVSNRKNYLKDDEKPKNIVLLEDSLDRINAALNDFKSDKENIIFEKELMLANKSVGSNQTGVKSDDLEDLLVLYKKKLREFKIEWYRLIALETKYNLYKQKIENQLREFQNSFNQNSPEILVTVKTLSPINEAKIELDYLVRGASWKPFYDIRVKDTKSPLQLVSKAFITQSTREDWKNVIIKLSTSNPNEGVTKPELQTDYLKYQQPISQTQSYSNAPTMRGARSEGGVLYDAVITRKEEVGIATVQQTAVSIEFNVTSAYNISSDNTPHQVDLTASNLDAVYSYGALPKLDKDAFITAKVSGNDLVNQISGEANVYFDGTFVGKTFINGTTNDSLTLSLGRDKRIQIQRVKLKDFSSKTFSGSTKKELNTWEIKIRNTRKEPIQILVEDQIPVSSDKEIEVKLINAEKAKFDETTGRLSWLITLDPEQSQSVKFSFEVKYPKEKMISEY
jgi:uncharacterized protein (TIGR02231 family)